MTIVTKTGDRGETGLFGSQRVKKSDLRMHAIGTVDELNAVLGLALAEKDLPDGIRRGITRIQHELFRIGADLATPSSANGPNVQRATPDMTEGLEEWISAWEAWLPAQQYFILPGGSRTGAILHLARTVCRRAERWTVALGEKETINPDIQKYLNRLGDCLFLLARAVNRENGVEDVRVVYRKAEDEPGSA